MQAFWDRTLEDLAGCCRPKDRPWNVWDAGHVKGASEKESQGAFSIPKVSNLVWENVNSVHHCLRLIVTPE